MNRESLLINFIRENLKLLQQNPFPEDLYKKVKHDYFFGKKDLMWKPKDSEIAQTCVFYMIRKNLVKDEISLSTLLELPFFDTHVFKGEIFFDALRLKNPNTLVIIEPSKLDDAEYVQKVEYEIKQKLIIENQSFFDKERDKFKQEIEQAKKQLATIPTKLEKEEFVEPEVTEEEEPQKQEWWQILNLKGDPFPVAEGLQKISRDFYEHIVVRTDIFRKYVNYADNLRDQIFKNTIFYGDFGSGKTAFFDYLKEIFLRNKILSIYVPLWIGLDGDTNIYNFEEELISRLREESKRYGVYVDDKDHKNHPQIIKNVLRLLLEQTTFKGLIVFVDDLHKNTRAFDAVIDFLSYLQIFTSSLTKGSDVNMAIYVAGIPQWKTRITSEPRLSGSLIRDEMMPEVTEQDAYDMLNKRMLAFSKNEDKKNIIGRAFVRQIYESLKRNNVTVTFREFLRKALEEFRNSNFDNVLTVNPRAIPTNTVHEIRNMLYEKPKLSYQFDQLLTLIADSQPENKQKCFELLGSIYLDKGIYENSPQGDRNLWAFQQLERSGLIHYMHESTGVRWVISKDLQEGNRDALNKYHVSMEDYLVPAFIGNPIYRKRKLQSPELEVLDFLAKRKQGDEQQMINETIKIYKPLLAIDQAHTINIVPVELVDKCTQSLSLLTRTFALVQNTKLLPSDDAKALHLWKKFWHKPASMIEFINQVENKESLDINRANFIFGLYKESFTDIVMFMKDQEEKDRIFSISYHDLTEEDCLVLDKARELWAKKEYFEMCSTAVQHLESKLRQHIFNILSLFYGSEENRIKRLDPKLCDKVLSNNRKDDKKGMSPISNELQHLDRKDYKSLMTLGFLDKPSEMGHKNWEEIFSYIFSPWKETDLLDFLNKFGDFNTSTSHGKTEAITADQQPDLRQFVINSMFFLQKLNSFYSRILMETAKRYDSKFYFGFKPDVDIHNQNDVHITSEEYNHLVKRMSSMEEIIVHMHDRGFLQAFYNLDYRKFVMVLNLLLNINGERIKKVGCKLIMTEDAAPTFQFKLETINP